MCYLQVLNLTSSEEMKKYFEPVEVGDTEIELTSAGLINKSIFKKFEIIKGKIKLWLF